MLLFRYLIVFSEPDLEKLASFKSLTEIYVANQSSLYSVLKTKEKGNIMPTILYSPKKRIFRRITLAKITTDLYILRLRG